MTPQSIESKEIPIPEEFQNEIWTASSNHIVDIDEEYKEYAEIDFGDGARWAYRHLYTQSVEGMRWVDLKERKPKKVALYLVKYSDGRSGESNWFMNEFPSAPNRHVTHWLDESPSLSPLKEVEKEEEK